MKKEIIKTILLILLFVLLIFYSMMIKQYFCDEIWEYGYGYNIATGLVPYRDFNMVVTPLFPFFIAIFIKIFGNYLLSAHIFNIIIFIFMVGMMYKIIGNKTLIIVPILLYSEYNILPSYNGLITFLAVLLVYIKQANIKEKNKVLLSGLIISLMVLTKQSIGGVFFILELFLTKDKKKYLTVFSIPIIIFIIYLITNKALYNFIDYSILGMFDFANKNTIISPWLIIFIIMLIYLIILYIKHKKNNILYAIAFMSICVPMLEEVHFIPNICFFLFTILQYINYKQFLTKYLVIYSLLFLILMSLLKYKIEDNNTIYGKTNYLYSKSNYLLGKNVGPSETIDVLETTSEKLNKIEKDYDKVYYFTGLMGYMIRLYRNEQIDKFDMILDGNMGHNGAKKYIKEIDDYCKDHKCLFLLTEYKDLKNDQLNHDIIDYVKKNYKFKEQTKYFYYFSN